MMKPSTFLFSVCLCLPSLTAESVAQYWGRLPEANIPQEPDPIAQYEEYIHRLPFLYHTWGRTVLAKVGQAESLALLLEDYRRPVAYQEFARYTMSELFGRYFGDDVWMDEFAQLRADHDGPGDMWMWVNTLALSDDDEDTAAVIQMVRESKDVIHQAAAIEALAFRGRQAVIDVIAEVCAEFPRKNKPGERRLLVSALSSAVLANKSILADPKMQSAIRAYINLLDEDVGLSHSAKMVIARHLAKTIGIDRRYIEPEPWIRLLDQNYSPPKRLGETVSQLRFFGIEAEGDRICYLIDMSNSMLRPIDPDLLRKGPITGPRRRERGQIPDENDIRWHLVESRFDLAREHLKISIQRLSKDKRFSVVWFGDEAGHLESTPGMIPATRSNISRVLRELDAIEATPRPPNLAEADAPHGILKGETNLHGGLLRAFSMQARGFAKGFDAVDLKAIAEGCDTIFLMTDGAPSVDDFEIVDDYYGDGTIVREREFGREVEMVHDVTYHGPMVYPNWLLAELRRMNVFRKVPVHCIGIGEADIDLLRALAESSQGEVFLLGAKAKAAGRKEP